MSRLEELQVLLDHLSNETNLLHQAKLRRKIQKMFKEQAERAEELERKHVAGELAVQEFKNIATEAIEWYEIAYNRNQRYKQALEDIFYFDERYGCFPSYEDCRIIIEEALKEDKPK